ETNYAVTSGLCSQLNPRRFWAACISDNQLLNHTEKRKASMFSSRYASRIVIVSLLTVALPFATACNRDPNVRKQKYMESGKRYEDSGKYKEAAIQFANALKVDKNFAAAHFELAKTYLKLNNGNLAYAELMRTIELDSKNQ